MYLLDTPGVLPPKIESVETGMKLALCGEQKINPLIFLQHTNYWENDVNIYFFPPGTILDHLVGEDIIADYLLYSLNRLEKFRCDFPFSFSLFFSFFNCLINFHAQILFLHALSGPWSKKGDTEACCCIFASQR